MKIMGEQCENILTCQKNTENIACCLRFKDIVWHTKVSGV